MVELRRSDKIEELNNRFIHKLKFIYPKENVENMKKVWSEGIVEADEWLGKYDETLKVQIDTGIKNMVDTLDKVGKALGEFEKLSKEEQVKKLREEYANQVEKHKVAKETIEDAKKEYIEAVTKQLLQVKERVVQKKEEKIGALKLWNSSVKKL